MTNYGDIFRSSDEGNTWTSIAAGLNYPSTIAMFAKSDTVFASTLGGRYRSINSGDSWTTVNTTADSAAGQSWSFAEVASEVFTVSSNGVFKSTNYGLSWQHVDSGLHYDRPHMILGFSSIAAIDSVLFVGSSGNNLVGGLFRSTDKGRTWTELDTNFGSTVVDVLFTYGHNLLMARNDSVFLSTNKGNSWSSISNGLPKSGSITKFTSNGTSIFAGTRGYGVFMSEDTGRSWNAVNAGLSHNGLSVDALMVYGKYLFEGYSDGVYRRPLSEMISQSAVAKSAAPIQTIHCHPNPFSSSTQITFSPATSGHADISIVNQLGVEVARIFSGELEAGEHSFTWDAQAKACATSGMYECVVRMNGRVETLPIVLMR